MQNVKIWTPNAIVGQIEVNVIKTQITCGETVQSLAIFVNDR